MVQKVADVLQHIRTFWPYDFELKRPLVEVVAQLHIQIDVGLRLAGTGCGAVHNQRQGARRLTGACVSRRAERARRVVVAHHQANRMLAHTAEIVGGRTGAVVVENFAFNGIDEDFGFVHIARIRTAHTGRKAQSAHAAHRRLFGRGCKYARRPVGDVAPPLIVGRTAVVAQLARRNHGRLSLLRPTFNTAHARDRHEGVPPVRAAGRRPGASARLPATSVCPTLP